MYPYEMPYSLKTRINEAFNELEPPRSKTELWKACGVTSGAVTGWFNGSIRQLKGENARKVAEFLGVNRDWLAEGKGPKRGSTKGFSDSIKEEAHLNPYVLIDQALAALVIVGKDREEILETIRSKAEHASLIRAQLMKNLSKTHLDQ